jgi:hypothetical protein
MSVLDHESLVKLREAKEEALETTAVATEAESRYRRLVVQAFRKHGQPIQKTSVCLDCGEMFPIGDLHKCPEGVDAK